MPARTWRDMSMVGSSNHCEGSPSISAVRRSAASSGSTSARRYPARLAEASARYQCLGRSVVRGSRYRRVVSFKMSPEGYRRLLEEAAAKISEQDHRFRATHKGLPVEVVMADFADLGPALELPEETLRAYATAVSNGDPFEWVLGD